MTSAPLIRTTNRVLLVMCTLLFLLCTVHVGASAQQLLEAFVYAPVDVPDYSTAYWIEYPTTLRVLKNNVYITLVRNTRKPRVTLKGAI